jgi:hypothetical protein
MLEWLPSETELMQDVSPADWIMRSLRSSDRESGGRLSSFMPDGFEAYARVFHPARDGERSVRWAELGADHGVSLTPDVAFSEVVRKDQRDPNAYDIDPLDGHLPSAECAALSRLLHPHTGSPETCWFCLWEGDGAFWSQAHSVLSTGRARRRRAKATAQDEFLRSVPKVMAESRSYFLFRGPLEAACAFKIDGWDLPPNIWWPDDRSWCVVTEIDGYSTYVGATRAAIDELLTSNELEAIEVSLDVPLDPGPFQPRWR